MIRTCAKSIQRVLAGKNWAQQLEARRMLSLLEHEGMQLLQRAGIAVPDFEVALTEDDAYDIAQRLGGKNLTVKAEVPEFAGDRTKGMFDSGLRGCVHFVFSPDEAKYIASKMLGSALRTGTGPEKEMRSICEHVLIRRRSYATRKARVRIELDTEKNGPVLFGCKVGVSDCGECKVPKKGPCPIFKMPVDIETGLKRDDAFLMAKGLEFKKPNIAADALMQLYDVFVTNDCKTLEIYSLTEDISGEIYCYDCSMIIDDDARFRLQNTISLTDPRWRTYQSPKFDPHYSDSVANIACIVNGSGLGMASMDCIKSSGGNAARCEEVGGGGTHVEPDQLTRTLKSMMADKQIHAILINIFDARSTDEMISKGILHALNDLEPSQAHIPIILRLQGAQQSSGMNVVNQLLDSVLPPIYACDDFDGAVKLTIDMANNVSHQQKLLASHHDVIDDDERANVLLQAATAARMHTGDEKRAMLNLV